MDKILEFAQSLPEKAKIGNLFSKTEPEVHFSREFMIGSAIGLLIFILYLELNPKLGNVWYRVDENGQKTINLSSLGNFLKQPFNSKELWKPKNWDLNFITFSGMSGLGYYAIQKMIYYKNILF